MTPINTSNTSGVNRGVELILRKRRENAEKEPGPDNMVCFLKSISLFRREITISFKLSLTKTKKN
jgi:hypothetical protein